MLTSFYAVIMNQKTKFVSEEMTLHVSVFISILAAWDVFTVTSLNGCKAECSTNVHNLAPLDLEILSYHYFYTQLPKKS